MELSPRGVISLLRPNVRVQVFHCITVEKNDCSIGSVPIIFLVFVRITLSVHSIYVITCHLVDGYFQGYIVIVLPERSLSGY